LITQNAGRFIEVVRKARQAKGPAPS